MKNRLLTLLATIICIAASNATFAQDEGAMPSRVDLEQRVDNTVDDLKLSEDQAAQFKKLELEFIDARKAKMDNASDLKMANVAVQEMEDEKMEKMKSILTPEQFEIYQNIRPKKLPRKKKRKASNLKDDEN